MGGDKGEGERTEYHPHFTLLNSKESRPRGPGFDLSPEEICVACYFSVFWNNGVMG
jgi:hypothetical protein